MFNKVFTKILYFKISQSNRAPKECKKNEVFFSFSHLKMCQMMEVYLVPSF